MQVLYDAELPVAYMQFYVNGHDEGIGVGPDEARAGQANGLCGAAVPGFLFLTTGMHTGDVPLRVERHDAQPAIAAEWEDIVEASFTPTGRRVLLESWDGDFWPLDLEQTTYRVRYCANGMDAGHERDMRDAGEPVVDRYLMQFWPAPPQADRIVSQSSQSATYWNSLTD